MMFRSFATALALILSAASADAAPFKLKFLGAYALPNKTDFEGVRVGGFSGLQRMPDGSYVALSDDRGGAGRPPRFYNLTLNYDGAGFHGVTINRQITLKDKNGVPFPTDRNTVDPEAVRLLSNGNLLISSEGNFSADPAKLHQPFVAEFTPDGRMVRELKIPEGYKYTDGLTSGARNNQLFEALGVAPSGKVFVGNEGPLTTDGGYPAGKGDKGAVVRIAELDPNGGDPKAQYAYQLPEIPREGTAGAPLLVDMLALGDSSFLTLERSYRAGKNFISLAYATTKGATDILGKKALTDGGYTPMTRELLLGMDDPFKGVDIDNMEAMAFGKRLSNGNLSLILASDDNFNPRYQRTLFMAFEIAPNIAPVPLPAALPLLVAALGGLAALRRRA